MHLDPLRSNPFHVLDVAPDADPMAVERAGARLLGMLDLGVSGAALYETPYGVEDRTPQLVREALAALRDPQRRLVYEVWARVRHAPEPGDDEPAPWPGALTHLGVGRP